VKTHRDGIGCVAHLGGASPVAQRDGIAVNTHLGGASAKVTVTVRLGCSTGVVLADAVIDECPTAFLAPRTATTPAACVVAEPGRLR
jgi:hypothetical protein